MANRKKEDLKSAIVNIFEQEIEPARKAARTSLSASVKEFLSVNVEEISGHNEPLADVFCAYKNWAGQYFVPGTTGEDFIFSVVQNNLKIGISVTGNIFYHTETVVLQDVILKCQSDIETVIVDEAGKQSSEEILQPKTQNSQKKNEKQKNSDPQKLESKNHEGNKQGKESDIKLLENSEEGKEGSNNG